jgi:hypothetical protein
MAKVVRPRQGVVESKAGPRYRTQDEPVLSGIVGTNYLVDGSGNKINPSPLTYNTYPVIKRMWDESHKLERARIGGYVTKSRLGHGTPQLVDLHHHFIYGRPQHNSGGPLLYYHIRNQPRSEIQGIGSYYGNDLRPYGFAYLYEGGFVPSGWPHGYSITEVANAGNAGRLDMNFMSPNSYAAEAYNRYKPKITQFDAMQFVFDDLKDLPGQLETTAHGLHRAYQALLGKTPGARKAAAKSLVMPDSVADQYLNQVFGWLPFLGDMSKLFKTYNGQNRKMAEISRQNGTWIKRGGNVLREREIIEYATVDNFSGYVYPALSSSFYRSAGSWVTSHLYYTLEREIWFDGSFKFYAPEFDSLNRASEGPYGEIMRLMHYYGVRISPTVIWELTPWTWLGDWFYDASGIIDNITSSIFDRLVSRYAYLMQRIDISAHNDSTIHLKDGDLSLHWEQNVTMKTRKAADPYGFDSVGSIFDLTSRQSMILGALGITHRPH